MANDEMPDVIWFENHTYDHSAYWIGKNREGDGRTKYIRAQEPIEGLREAIELMEKQPKTMTWQLTILQATKRQLESEE